MANALQDFRGGCWGCGRMDVKKRPNRGKLHYRHKCQHGANCVAGHPLAGIAGNNWPRCAECRREAESQYKGEMPK